MKISETKKELKCHPIKFYGIAGDTLFRCSVCYGAYWGSEHADEIQKECNSELEIPEIDWQLNMARSIAGQILNNEECNKNPLRVLALSGIIIGDRLRNENENKR